MRVAKNIVMQGIRGARLHKLACEKRLHFLLAVKTARYYTAAKKNSVSLTLDMFAAEEFDTEREGFKKRQSTNRQFQKQP